MQYIELLSYCIYYISSFLLSAPLKRWHAWVAQLVFNYFSFQFYWRTRIADASHKCTMLYGKQKLCERKTGAFDNYIWLKLKCLINEKLFCCNTTQYMTQDIKMRCYSYMANRSINFTILFEVSTYSTL